MNNQIISCHPKKAFLDYLFYKVGAQQYNFYLAGTYIKDCEQMFTKWKKYSNCIFPMDADGTCEDWKVKKFFDGINQRQILPCEIVLDVEEKKQIKPIIEQLEKWKWEYSIWETGSRGYHIHILGDADMNEDKKLAIVKTLGTDVQKCSDKCLIALENISHWKGKGIKTEISKEEILNGK